MATRSFISIKTGKEFRTIYCHWNGYPEYNGVVLLKHYSTIERIEALLALGSVSYIDKELAPKAGTLHNFYNKQKGVTMAYHRDRGDTYTPPRCHTYKGLKQEEYNYVFNSITKTWFVRAYNGYGKWQPLAKVIAAIAPEKLQA